MGGGGDGHGGGEGGGDHGGSEGGSSIVSSGGGGEGGNSDRSVATCASTKPDALARGRARELPFCRAPLAAAHALGPVAVLLRDRLGEGHAARVSFQGRRAICRGR